MSKKVVLSKWALNILIYYDLFFFSELKCNISLQLSNIGLSQLDLTKERFLFYLLFDYLIFENLGLIQF